MSHGTSSSSLHPSDGAKLVGNDRIELTNVESAGTLRLCQGDSQLLNKGVGGTLRLIDFEAHEHALRQSSDTIEDARILRAASLGV